MIPIRKSRGSLRGSLKCATEKTAALNSTETGVGSLHEIWKKNTSLSDEE